MFNQKNLKKLDIVLLVFFPLFSVITSLAVKAGFFLSILLFFGPPIIWLSYRTPKMIKKTALFSLLFSIPLTLIVDYISVVSKAWFIPESIFPFRLFGVIALEQFIWGFLFIYLVLIFYEHFLDKGKHNLIDKRMKYLIIPLIIILIVFFIVLLMKPEFLIVKYSYLWMGVIIVFLPTITVLSFFPKLLSKYVKTGSYFFVWTFLYELTALELNQWTFPGDHFVGWIEFLGYKFPFEEFFFWFILAAIAIISYYEFFDDDRK